MSQRVPVIEGLFSGEAKVRAVGLALHDVCDAVLPKSPVCHNPACDESRIEDASFGPHGVLFSCAVQNYPPPPPGSTTSPTSRTRSA